MYNLVVRRSYQEDFQRAAARAGLSAGRKRVHPGFERLHAFGQGLQRPEQHRRVLRQQHAVGGRVHDVAGGLLGDDSEPGRLVVVLLAIAEVDDFGGQSVGQQPGELVPRERSDVLLVRLAADGKEDAP